MGKTAILAAVDGGKGVPLSAGPGYSRVGPPPFREPSNRVPADAVRVLLAAGADVNAVGPDGATALHKAVDLRNLDTLRALTDGGADLEAKNGDGLTALALAEKLEPDDPNANPFGPPKNKDGATPEEVVALLRDAQQEASGRDARGVRHARGAMRKSIYIAGGCVAAALAVGVGAYLRLASAPEAVLEDRWAMLDEYCVGCHNDAELTGDVSFERRTPDDVVQDARVWEAAIRKLRLGMMPPRDEPQPDAEHREAFVAALESTLDSAAAAHPHAGAQAVHRLNRTEYANAIRDLLGVEVDVAELLPSDGGDFGFDNIAAALTTSPLLLERYLTAGAAHQRRWPSAIAEPSDRARRRTRSAVEVTQNQHVDGLPLGTRGGTVVTHHFPADGEYMFSGRLLRTVAEGYVGVEGHETPHQFVVTIDGEQVFSAPIGGTDGSRGQRQGHPRVARR